MSGHLSDKRIGSVFPRVVLVTTNPGELLEQDYPHIVVEKQVDKPTQAFFNEQLDAIYDEPESDLDVVYGFVPENSNFLTDNAVSAIVNKLYEHDMIGSLYADLIVRENDLAIRHYLPAFHANMLGGDIIINSPIFVKRNELKKHPSLKFSGDLKLLYMHLFLHQVMRKIFAAHIAEALYVIDVPKNINMNFELHTVKKCLSQ